MHTTKMNLSSSAERQMAASQAGRVERWMDAPKINECRKDTKCPLKALSALYAYADQTSEALFSAPNDSKHGTDQPCCHGGGSQ